LGKALFSLYIMRGGSINVRPVRGGRGAGKRKVKNRRYHENNDLFVPTRTTKGAPEKWESVRLNVSEDDRRTGLGGKQNGGVPARSAARDGHSSLGREMPLGKIGRTERPLSVQDAQA